MDQTSISPLSEMSLKTYLDMMDQRLDSMLGNHLCASGPNQLLTVEKYELLKTRAVCVKASRFQLDQLLKNHYVAITKQFGLRWTWCSEYLYFANESDVTMFMLMFGDCL
jgi:hypothetical protein